MVLSKKLLPLLTLVVTYSIVSCGNKEQNQENSPTKKDLNPSLELKKKEPAKKPLKQKNKKKQRDTLKPISIVP